MASRGSAPSWHPLLHRNRWSGDAPQKADYAADTSTDDIALRRAGATTRAISRELGISHSTVREYLARIAAAGITWPLPAELTDRELEQRLFVNGGVRVGARQVVEPDWAALAREQTRPGVNWTIQSEEYRAVPF